MIFGRKMMIFCAVDKEADRPIDKLSSVGPTRIKLLIFKKMEQQIF
jgi:hypothetical protein